MKKIFQFFFGVVKRYPEIISLPIALLTWMISITVLRWLDPTSAVYDAGIFQIPIFAIIQFFLFLSISWLALKLIYGTVRHYLQFDFKQQFYKLSEWQKIKLSFCVFFSLLLTLVLLAQTLTA